MQKWIIAVGAGCILIAVGLATTDRDESPDPRSELRFSNTQEWDETYLPFLTENLATSTRADIERYLTTITLPPPPGNISDETAAELALLHEYVRTERDTAQADIEAEVYASNLQWGGFVYGDNNKPLTTELLLTARDYLLVAVMTLKHDFDRVRPTHLDPTLAASIPIPGHPAYPSGHASEAHVNAIILSLLDPAQQEIYRADAARIAKNREIAGVHYPSDSAAGKQFAEQFVPLFLATKEGQALFTAARAEWE